MLSETFYIAGHILRFSAGLVHFILLIFWEEMLPLPFIVEMLHSAGAKNKFHKTQATILGAMFLQWSSCPFLSSEWDILQYLAGAFPFQTPVV